ncbi:hypothetical protein MSAN_01062700 [Mycena sanguinolenta]|uniref:Uncharacterized protein n=1 Tax=Mycena sanguinolenta TaxID=230812 RepID=A0A8H6YUC9_9AGAR|nr:hypothetical protein MSAN_01062700 [Mycena sanguinolenta]
MLITVCYSPLGGDIRSILLSFPPSCVLLVFLPPCVMDSASWGRGDHDSTSGAGSLCRRVRQAPVNRSFQAPRATGRPEYSSSFSGARRSKLRHLRAALKARAAADAQTSLTLDPSVIASSFTRNGVIAVSDVPNNASLTSSNNFINFCATTTAPISNGAQLASGSCNPAPMGLIPTVNNMPSVLITQPAKGATVQANTTFSLQLLATNLQTGVFTSFTSNFLSAPQQLNSAGLVLGHFHVVIDPLDALDSTFPTDSLDFAYFSIVLDAATAGEINTEVTNGLPEGFYRMTVTPRAANHQPVLVPTAEHGALNDVTYFTVTADGNPGSIPAVKRRSLRPVYTPRHAAEAQRTVFRRDNATAAQTSLTLLSSVIATGFESAQDVSRPGQSSSLTSSNNFINFCDTTTLPLINGTTQTVTGFCNPAPLGLLPAATQMACSPTSKFTYPRNGDIIAPDASMTIGLAVTNFATGDFANEDTNFLAAPQQLDSNGLIQGHPYIVIEQLSSDTPAPSNPLKFVFLKGMTGVADNTGVITTTMSGGLPVGSYRLSSIIAAANSQPVLLPILEHGAVDDAIYFTVEDGASLPTNQTALPISPSTSASATAGVPTRSATSSSPASAAIKQTNVAAAVGGALAGIALIALGIIGIWFFIRQRRNRRARMLNGSVVLTSEDFDALQPVPFVAETSGGPSMSKLTSPPAAYVSEKSPPPRRTSSLVSAAPSYHTVLRM